MFSICPFKKNYVGQIGINLIFWENQQFPSIHAHFLVTLLMAAFTALKFKPSQKAANGKTGTGKKLEGKLVGYAVINTIMGVIGAKMVSDKSNRRLAGEF